MDIVMLFRVYCCFLIWYPLNRCESGPLIYVGFHIAEHRGVLFLVMSFVMRLPSLMVLDALIFFMRFGLVRFLCPLC